MIIKGLKQLEVVGKIECLLSQELIKGGWNKSCGRKISKERITGGN